MNIFTNIVAWLFSAGLFISSVLIIPQIIKIYRTKTVRNLSLITYIGFEFFQITFILHGYFFNDLPILIGMSFTLICNTIVLAQIFYYRTIQSSAATFNQRHD